MERLNEENLVSNSRKLARAKEKQDSTLKDPILNRLILERNEKIVILRMFW